MNYEEIEHKLNIRFLDIHIEFCNRRDTTFPTEDGYSKKEYIKRMKEFIQDLNQGIHNPRFPEDTLSKIRELIFAAESKLDWIKNL